MYHLRPNPEFIFDKFDTLFPNHKYVVLQGNIPRVKKKGQKIAGKVKVIFSDGHNYGILLDKRTCDNGFTRLAVYDKVGEYPMDAISWGMEKNRYVGKINGEIWFGKRCNKYKYKRALAYKANSGMIFDCAYVRGNDRYGDYFPPPGKYYFKILGSDEIKKINKRAKRNKFSYIEDFCIPDGWVPKTYDKHGNINIKRKINE